MSEGDGKLYYGWKIVWALLVQLTFTSGLSFYNHAIYLNALAEKPAFDVQSASAAVSVFFLSGGITGLYVARWVQNYDPRLCITGGALLASFSLGSLPWVNALWQLFFVYALFGAGFAASALLPATTLITRWFRRRRAMALSIASTGLSLGGVLLTPLSVLLVDQFGFEIAAPILGVMFTLGVIPVAWIWLRPYPKSMGLYVDGDEASEPALSESPDALYSNDSGISYGDALGGRFFWCVSIAYVFLMMAQVGGIAHQYGLAREQLNDAQTAIAVAILPVASIVGRLIGGWLVDRMSIRIFSIGMMILQATSLAMLAGGFSVISLCIGLFMFGASVGNLLMLQPLILAEAFGVRDYPRIFSVSNLMSSLGTSIGPALMGVVYSTTGGSYAVPYTVIAAAGAIGLALFLAGGKIEHVSALTDSQNMK